MTDHNASQGVETAMGGLNAASKSMQTFATEITRMSKESIEHTTQLVEKLRGAKTMEDVVSIQSNFMQQSFTNYANYTKRFGELVTMLPLEMAKQGRTAMQKATDTVTKTAEQAGQQVQRAVEPIAHNQGYDNNNQNYSQNNDYNNNNNYNNNQNHNNY